MDASTSRSDQTQACNGRQSAPSFPVSQDAIVCVEHPCIIKNLDRGVRSLGGEHVINRFLDAASLTKTIEVSLRPEDVMAKTIASKQVDVNQLVLKVTAPRRTGRKRKRGSNGPFLAESHIHNGNSQASSAKSRGLEAEAALRALSDNPDRYGVEVVGQIQEAHRFRSLPDYQYATSSNSIMRDLRETIMSNNLDKIKNFKLNMESLLSPDQNVGPPPYHTLVKQPYNWSYRQNVYVKTVTDETGAVQTVNVTAPAKHVRTYIDPDAEQVPTGPPEVLAPEGTLMPRLQDIIHRLRAELNKRPLMQKRVYVNAFGGQHEFELKQAAGYCGYTFSSGPFKDVLIKFGVDPRSDPKYRVYQAVSFQIAEEGKTAPDDPGHHMARRGGRRVFSKKPTVPHTHIFDGQKFYSDGKVWQACDITDPFLKKLLDTSELRSQCDMTFSGWYGNGTWSLFRRIMKHKIQVLGEGRIPNDDMYEAIATMFPTFVDDTNIGMTQADKNGFLAQSKYADFPMDSEASLLASEVRTMAMAAHRYRGRHYRGRQRRLTSTTPLPGNAASPTEPGADAHDSAELQDEEDAALIGLDSDSEEEQEDELGEGQEMDEDEQE